MSLLSAGQLAQSGEFIAKVRVAMSVAAKAVAAEAETNFIAYQKRHDFAVALLNYPESKLTAFCYAVVANPAIDAQSDDGAIEFTVNSVFDSFAGVKPSDRTTEIAAPTL